jgi:hypothetical protein
MKPIILDELYRLMEPKNEPYGKIQKYRCNEDRNEKRIALK